MVSADTVIVDVAVGSGGFPADTLTTDTVDFRYYGDSIRAVSVDVTVGAGGFY